jgi:hypothetical protein
LTCGDVVWALWGTDKALKDGCVGARAEVDGIGWMGQGLLSKEAASVGTSDNL